LKYRVFEIRELISFITMSCLIILAALPLLFYGSQGYLPDVLLKEDGLHESIAAITCIFTALALAWVGIKNRSSSKLVTFWLLSFSVSLFFLGGEEISWGQRIIDFDTPESIAKTNYQNEFNLHNSTLIQSHNNMFSVYLTKILVLYLVIFSIFVNAFPTVLKFIKMIKIPTPSLAVALTALIAQLLSAQSFRLIYGSTEIADSLSIGEAFESVLELCLCWVAWSYIFLTIRNSANWSRQRILGS
jgi:hypothetical protein